MLYITVQLCYIFQTVYVFKFLFLLIRIKHPDVKSLSMRLLIFQKHIDKANGLMFKKHFK